MLLENSNDSSSLDMFGTSCHWFGLFHLIQKMTASCTKKSFVCLFFYPWCKFKIVILLRACWLRKLEQLLYEALVPWIIKNKYFLFSLKKFFRWNKFENTGTVKVKLTSFSSVQVISCVWLFATSLTAARQASLSITTPGACLNSCPLSHWCHPTISSSVVPFSSWPQSFQHQGLFQWVSSLHQGAKVLEFQLIK